MRKQQGEGGMASMEGLRENSSVFGYHLPRAAYKACREATMTLLRADSTSARTNTDCLQSCTAPQGNIRAVLTVTGHTIAESQ